MHIIDIILCIGIIIMYNLFVHNLASLSYKDLQYDEKHQNTIIMLILFGGIGIILSRMINNKFKKKKYLINGLYYGSILLIITALFANWEIIAEEMKLIFIVAVLGFIIWYGNEREK